MWNNYFLQIKKKYTMKVSSKNPLIIILDGKDITKSKEMNILEKYKGSFREIIEQSAQYFTKKYECIAIFGADEISFVFEEPMKLIEDLNTDKDTFSSEIISVFSQYFFDYFNRFYDGDNVFWHGKCFSIHSDKIKSFIKYKSRLIQVLTTTYFLKRKGVLNAGNIKLNEKIKMCEKYGDYEKFKIVEKGILYLKGKQIDLLEFINGNVVYIDSNNSIEKEKNIDIDINDDMFSDILNL